MAIYREVTTDVYCDVCGENILSWSSRVGVSKAWAAYYARQKGCTTGKKIVCKQCRINKRMEKCSLRKKYGATDTNSACSGIPDKFNDETIEKCRQCIAYSSFDWNKEKGRLKKMNVLEKILEEIKRIEDEYCHDVHSLMLCMGACSMAADVKEIIYSHMGDILDVGAEEKYILYTLGEDGVLSEYDDTYDVTIHCSSKEDQDQTVKIIKESNWIPTSERLPNEQEFKTHYRRNHHAAEFIVTINGATKSTTLYFKNGFWFDEENNYYNVLAWKPLPEPYRPEEG